MNYLLTSFLIGSLFVLIHFELCSLNLESHLISLTQDLFLIRFHPPRTQKRNRLFLSHRETAKRTHNPTHELDQYSKTRTDKHEYDTNKPQIYPLESSLGSKGRVVSLLWTLTPSLSLECKNWVATRRTLLSNSEEVPVSQLSPPGLPVIKVMHRQDLNKRILIALIVASTLLAGVLCFLVCFWIVRRKRLKASSKSSSQTEDAARGPALISTIGKLSSSGIGGKQGSLAVFEYQLLEVATNHFAESNIVGEGGYGLVYEARFSEKFIAAVKELGIVGLDSQRGFENEVNWLSKIRHPNIVTLLGYCVHGESRCLVYEMMQNGSLEKQLHGPSRGSALTWPLRMKIAVDVAKGLEFLHERCSPPVVHRDLKSSNILLDSDFNAKLCDFGLAVTAGTQNKDKIKLADSVGYLAPEYLSGGKLTDKSDVYAFGVILLELLMGRKPVEETAAAQRQSLVTWAMPQLTDRAKLPNILDSAIKDTMDLKHLYQVAAVAVLCVQPEPSYRPLITDVLHSLIPLLPSELGGSLRVSEALSAEALKTSPETGD